MFAPLVFSWALASAAVDLPVLKEAPKFSLNDSQGGKKTQADLAGKVWVADFIFTRCGGQCPFLTTKMSELQKAFASEAGLRFVSFSVDPKNDTPKVLAGYAKKFGADTSRWFFLTGKPGQVQELSEKGFVLAAGAGGEEAIAHSFRFVLVDKKGFIRGFYPVNEPSKLEELRSAVTALLAE
ncbi:SCO family protein [bacterium]|nr:SCO family protein [bacterium]